MTNIQSLMDAAMKAGLAFQYNPERGAFESNAFRVTMCAAPYRLVDLGCTNPDAFPLYLHNPELVVKYIKMMSGLGG